MTAGDQTSALPQQLVFVHNCVAEPPEVSDTVILLKQIFRQTPCRAHNSSDKNVPCQGSAPITPSIAWVLRFLAMPR